MSVYEASITNAKKQLEFYRDLSEQLQREKKILENNNKTLVIQKEEAYKVADDYYKENLKLKKRNYRLDYVIDKYKSILDEIRECIDKTIFGYSDWEGTKPLYLKDDEAGKNLLQILDKVGKE